MDEQDLPIDQPPADCEPDLPVAEPDLPPAADGGEVPAPCDPPAAGAAAISPRAEFPLPSGRPGGGPDDPGPADDAEEDWDADIGEPLVPPPHGLARLLAERDSPDIAGTDAVRGGTIDEIE